MLKRTRNKVLATGIIALFALGAIWQSLESFSIYQKEHAKERANASRYEADAANKSPDTCDAVMLERGFFDWFTCLVEQISADTGTKNAEYDLKAQQEMAEWAFGMLIVTIWLTIITGIGVWFVILTLRSANATNEAANRANEIMRQEQRPWLKVGFEIPDGIRFGDDHVAINISPYCKNIGGRPAINGHFHAMAYCPHTVDIMDNTDPNCQEAFDNFIKKRMVWYKDDSENKPDRNTNTEVIFPSDKVKSEQFHNGLIRHKSGQEIDIIYIFVMVVYVDPTSLDEVKITAQSYGFTHFESQDAKMKNGDIIRLNMPAIAGKTYQLSDLDMFTSWLPNRIT